ncbi:unnamed protein product [Gordionus sp. m RMFG-2023]|uniref:ran-binding protein 3-like isoform X2 n=1 Tax=Gordionus sp. m RMFG-2023 TaxID=3053472 RepID=UPI0030E589B6
MFQNSKLFFKPSALNNQKSSCSLTSQELPFVLSNKNITSNLALSDNFANLTKTKLSPVKNDKKDHSSIEEAEYKDQPKDKKADDEKTTANLFIFGQNLQDRAENIDPKLQDEYKTKELNYGKSINKENIKKKDNNNDDNKVENLTFGQINKESKENHALSTSNSCPSDLKENTFEHGIKYKEINESARQHFEHLKELNKVQNLHDGNEPTGEENEITVFQAYGKLYEFHSEQSTWTEKGSGYLKLNDSKDNSDGLKSRLIMRNHGNLRLILNSKIFSKTTAENPNRKTLRFLAISDVFNNPNNPTNPTNESDINILTEEKKGLKAYLFKANNTNDIEILTSALNSRINEMARTESQNDHKIPQNKRPLENDHIGTALKNYENLTTYEDNDEQDLIVFDNSPDDKGVKRRRDEADGNENDKTNE